MSASEHPAVSRTHGAHDFDTVSTADIYTGKILALRADEVAMPGGRSARREVVEHPGAVAVVAVDEQDKIVLIHQYRHPLGRRLWELPAGLLDVVGEDPVRTAQRELVEEVGIAAREWAVLVDSAASPGFTDQAERVFLATGLTEESRPGSVGDEEADLVIRRVPLAEAVRMVFAGEIVNSTTVSGVLAAFAVYTGSATTRSADAPWPDRPHRFAARS